MKNLHNLRGSTQQPKRSRLLKWLRRIHAWIGLWGAVLGLLFGISGFLLNHRDVMKIPAAKMEQAQFLLTLPEQPPADAKILAKWLQTELHIDREPTKITIEKAKTVVWSGQNIKQPSQWRVDFHSPQRSVSAEYWEGNAFVSVKRQEANVFAFITRLHKGVGMEAGWVLLVDTLALGLVYLSLSGLFMWTKLHGSRSTMLGLGLTSFVLAVFFVLDSA